MSTTWQRKVARALFSCLLAALPAAASAQEPTGFEYVVKFVCGEGDARVVAKGEYYTAINVHNPNDEGLSFKKKFAIALPSEKAGRVSKFFDAKLGPDEAFEVDCPDIYKHTETPGGFLKGFAVFESARELDIVAVYTAAGATGVIETMDVEHVKGRRRGDTPGGVPDLVPVETKPQFCHREGSNLLVTIKNQGTGGAGPSTTRVVFNTGSPVTQPTPALGMGDVTTPALVFPIPNGCFNPDCQFRITADSAGVVTESDEANNTVSGTCLG